MKIKNSVPLDDIALSLQFSLFAHGLKLLGQTLRLTHKHTELIGNRKTNCHDKAVMESWNHSFKVEVNHGGL
ncbi:MAG: hypothetical protein HOO93_06985 [Methyloglobulus sp.]|nr:hypothetical protein [Methyloglobulus sp.]